MTQSLAPPAIARSRPHHSLLTSSNIVAIARTWLGTPYHHQASTKGAGTDCIGLVRGIFRDLYGREAEALPAYTRDWAEATGEETLIAAARRHLIEIAPADAAPGDVLLFRWRASAPAKHAAILATPTTMIHALEGAPVTEVSLTPWWRRHTAAAFAFPVVEVMRWTPPSSTWHAGRHLQHEG